MKHFEYRTVLGPLPNDAPFESELEAAAHFFWQVVMFLGGLLVLANAHGGCQ